MKNNIDKYRKKENGKFYLKQLSKETGELEWIEINTTSDVKPNHSFSDTQHLFFDTDYPDYVTES